MAYYTFNAVDGGNIYEIELFARNFRADSSGRVGFFGYDGKLIRMFEADEIMLDSIVKVNREEDRG